MLSRTRHPDDVRERQPAPALPTAAFLATMAVLPALAAAILISGCSDTTAPRTEFTDGTRSFNGSVDPAAASARLSAVATPPPGGVPIELELIGRNVRVEPGLEGSPLTDVVLDVSVRNTGATRLYPPAEIRILELPPGMAFQDPDWTACPDAAASGQASGGCSRSLSYQAALGDDEILAPGEESSPRAWRFRMPQAAPFSFKVLALFGLEPGRPLIGGVFFLDPNENGRLDQDEGPIGGGSVILDGPDLKNVGVPVGPDGHWSFMVGHAGRYALRGIPPPTVAPVHFTAPNPRVVVLTPGASGRLEDRLDVDFGIANDGPPGLPVRFHGGPASLIQQDRYQLLSILLDGTTLELRVGFSGCGPNHDLPLYMVGGFAGSNPAQAVILLSHNAFGELCDAYWERTLYFDLRPILEASARIPGGSGVVVLDFHAWDGEVTQLLLTGGAAMTGGPAAR